MVSLASVAEGDLRRRSTVGSMDTNEISHTKRLEVAVTTLCDCAGRPVGKKVGRLSSIQGVEADTRQCTEMQENTWARLRELRARQGSSHTT